MAEKPAFAQLSEILNSAKPRQLAALAFYYKIAMKPQMPEKREQRWNHFERTCTHEMKPLVCELHRIVNTITEQITRDTAE